MSKFNFLHFSANSALFLVGFCPSFSHAVTIIYNFKKQKSTVFYNFFKKFLTFFCLFLRFFPTPRRVFADFSKVTQFFDRIRSKISKKIFYANKKIFKFSYITLQSKQETTAATIEAASAHGIA